MKTKLSILSIVVVLTLVCVSLIVSGAAGSAASGQVSTARQPSDGVTATVYLPLVARSECLDRSVSVTFVANKPTVHVGDPISVTATVLDKGCADIFDVAVNIADGDHVEPMGSFNPLFTPDLHSGESGKLIFPFQSVAPGVATFTGAALYNYAPRPRGWLEYVLASPISVYISP